MMVPMSNDEVVSNPMTEPNLDKQIQYILNSLIRKRSISDNYDGIENATLDIQDIIANQVREARIDEIKRMREAMTFAHMTPSIYAAERIQTIIGDE